jgi:poly-gamma-glutamate capsule biosynthesis protein CapA/YwtB (metallophosphatase superfamily)
MTDKRENEVLLCAVGDIGLIGGVVDQMERFGPEYPFVHAIPILQKSDIAFGNLEMPFVHEGHSRLFLEDSEKFKAPPMGALGLKAAGFSVLSIANNHILDYGGQGISDTIDLLKQNRIPAVGAGQTLDEARRPLILQRGDLSVGFLAYSWPGRHCASAGQPGSAPLEVDVLAEDIGHLRKVADVIVVSLHFGLIYSDRPTPQDRKLAHQIIDLGAKIVLGHHPHVIQGIERYNGGLIAYSLGEFIFDPTAGMIHSDLAREKRRECMILRCLFNKSEILNVDIIPVRGNDRHQPEILEGETGEFILSRVEGLSGELSDDQFESRFWESAGSELVPYLSQGLLFHLKRLNLRYLFYKLTRLRARHFKLLSGFLRNKFKSFLIKNTQ